MKGKKQKDASLRLKVEFQATRKVLEVNERGVPTRLRFVVDRFVAADAGSGQPVLPQGAVLTVNRSEDPEQGSYRSSTGALSPQQEVALKLVVGTGVTPTTDDEAFGSTAPRKPGDSWPAAPEGMRRGLAGSGLDFSSAKLRGDVRLLGVKQVGSEQLLQLIVRAEAEGFDVPNLPEGSRMERSRFTMSRERWLPVDPDKPVSRQVSRGVMEFRAALPGDAKLELAIRRTTETEWEPR